MTICCHGMEKRPLLTSLSGRALSPGTSYFELLLSSVQNQVGWSIFIVLYPGQHYVCVCVHACFHIVLHVFGISRIQITSSEHMLASDSLFVSCLLVLVGFR